MTIFARISEQAQALGEEFALALTVLFIAQAPQRFDGWIGKSRDLATLNHDFDALDEVAALRYWIDAQSSATMLKLRRNHLRRWRQDHS